jgi:hypothetical protein
LRSTHPTSDAKRERIGHNHKRNIRFAKKPEKITFPILLPKDITKEQIPVGTEVLLLEEAYETVPKVRLAD